MSNMNFDVAVGWGVTATNIHPWHDKKCTVMADMAVWSMFAAVTSHSTTTSKFILMIWRAMSHWTTTANKTNFLVFGKTVSIYFLLHKYNSVTNKWHCLGPDVVHYIWLLPSETDLYLDGEDNQYRKYGNLLSAVLTKLWCCILYERAFFDSFSLWNTI